ncbi:uncharacterized protein LOC112563103 isoform X3 [Pomacea canaliculata]|uniref:uncharacterized protein LOC112563103 isoform X3 n=1 Tax=Pomacea canaliculata TaxID=400727 RepID=UPI000D72EE2F|nr:uncharacterized protein LOC112563103 isoform X3 [Pomacea canaliculata]
MSKTRKRKRRGGAGDAQVYLHAITDAQAALLVDKGNKRPLQTVMAKSGADVQFDHDPSPIRGMKIIVIRGAASQIEAAVRFVSQMTGAQGTISDQAEKFWLEWVQDAFPDLESEAYFLPPVYVNRVPVTRQSVGGHDILVFKPSTTMAGQLNQSTLSPSAAAAAAAQAPIPQPHVQECDVRDDLATQRVLFCLQKMAERNGEVMVGMSQLRFGQYLGEPCYAAAATQLPVAASLPAKESQRVGDFDVLLIHRHYGFVVCEVKALGDNMQRLGMSQSEIDNNIKKRLAEAISQLNKAEVMLSHLVSNNVSNLRIRKTIAVPNLTAIQVQQAILSDPQLTQDLCQCLGTTDPAAITGLCLCSDQLSDPKKPWDVNKFVLKELGKWWHRRVAGTRPDSLMTSVLYKILIARFCGPATTVTVPCTTPPRLCVKTLGQAVSITGEFYSAQIALFPEQVDLLNSASPRVFVTGPPGTGKTVVLLLMATEWLQRGNDVYILSTWDLSRTACIMLYHLLQQTVNTQRSAGRTTGQPRLLYCGFTLLKNDETNVVSDEEKVVNKLLQAANGGSLYIIVDEAGSDTASHFHTICDKLSSRVPRLHLWAASCYHGDAPTGWQVEVLTRPLRFPPAVVREIAQDAEVTETRDVEAYTERGVPDYTDGPPVKRLLHQGHGHSEEYTENCVTCGRRVARFLHRLRVGGQAITAMATRKATSRSMTPPCLQWRDVLVLHWGDLTDSSGLVTGLKGAGIPARVMEDCDSEDVATAHSDVVWVARGHRIHGLERKVVVYLEHCTMHLRLHLMSRSH